jgi:ATP-dependent Lhr-like helicase
MSDAVKTPFERLHPNLRHHIVNSLGWSSLREVQEMTIAPVLDGANTVILAPTAGGKTEAAFFPLITRMLDEEWEGMSLLYLSPIKALLNNQFERLEKLMELVGYTVGVWHGDISESKKKRMRKDPPHVLLTTPESLEGMLISTRTAGTRMFGDLRAVVIDEVHAFAGDDRGWHLLGVLQRLSAYAGRDVQRLGLSATVGNPAEIAAWLGRGSTREQATVDPPNRTPREPEVTLDWVGSLQNAAKIITKLHPGERRLVFCDSRIQTERLARELRAREVTTHVSHSSLSADERRRTEQAFAEGGPGVIVATSALELGIDIGSLDRVIQIDAPYSVASFLQRMGRTGRRPGATTNMLLLAITDAGLLRGAALLDMWQNGEVEPARAASAPYHILAQQMMALVLERPGLSVAEIAEAITPFREAVQIGARASKQLLGYLIERGYLFLDGVRLGIGRTGEDELGRRHFLGLVSVFTTPPVFKVMAHRKEIGEVHQSTFLADNSGDDNDDHRPLVILLAGRSWRVRSIDWSRRIAHVEPFDMPGKTRWMSLGQPMTRMLAQAHRRILTGSERGAAHWSNRARRALDSVRMGYGFLDPDVATILCGRDDTELWNFAGGQANQYLTACLGQLGLDVASTNALRIRFDKRHSVDELDRALTEVANGHLHPEVREDHPMLRGLKFSDLLPTELLQEAAQARIYGDEPWEGLREPTEVFERED